jgi:hypothetical protein
VRDTEETDEQKKNKKKNHDHEKCEGGVCRI